MLQCHRGETCEKLALWKFWVLCCFFFFLPAFIFSDKQKTNAVRPTKTKENKNDVGLTNDELPRVKDTNSTQSEFIFSFRPDLNPSPSKISNGLRSRARPGPSILCASLLREIQRELEREREREMATVVKSVVKAIRERGLRSYLKELKEDGFLNCIFDGNLTQTKIHNIGARLVGVDQIGNKYYEKLDTQYGRHRWVEYAEKSRYNASQVPPEWHGWLHYITDHTGDELLMLKPKRYSIEHKENFTGEGDEFIYHSKGHSLNPGQRDWTRYQPWEPAKKE